MLKEKIINLIENLIKKNYFLKYSIFNFYNSFFIRRRLSRQLKKKLNYKNISTNKKKKILIPLIETNHYQSFHLLIIAKALVLRGFNVKVLICDGFLSGCEIKSFKNRNDKNPCFICKNNIKNILPLFELDYIKFGDLIDTNDLKKINKISNLYLRGKKKKLVYKKFDFTQTIQDSLIRYYYGNTFFYNYKDVKLDHSNTAITSYIIAEKLNKSWKPDIILNNMYAYSSWEPLFKFYKNKCRVLSLNLSPLNSKSIYFNMFDLLISDFRFKKYLKIRKNKKLNLKEERSLNNYLKKRRLGNTEDMKKNSIFLDQNTHYENLVSKLDKLKKQNKKIIFLFTNVYWDIGLSDQIGLYKDVVSWTMDTIKILSKSNNHHIFIKTHPAEINKSAPSITTLEDVIRKKLKKIPENVTFIKPSYKVNAYKLSTKIDLGVIFTGTLGIEMILLGVPIIAVGSVPYRKLNFAIIPKNKKEYKYQLLIKKNSKPAYKRKMLKIYSYFYFIKSSIPWNLTPSAHGQRFNGFKFNSLDEIYPNKNKYLDHICNCITDTSCIPENW